MISITYNSTKGQGEGWGLAQKKEKRSQSPEVPCIILCSVSLLRPSQS